MKKLIFFVTVCVILTSYSFGEADFARGEALFMQNKPTEALAFLENAVAEDPAHIQAFLCMGIAYEQLGKLNEAAAVYRRILDRAGNLSACVSTNLGNVYFRMGNFDYAQQYYTRALNEDSAYSSACLGRANTRLKTGALRDAVADYESYLAMEPRSLQRSRIEQMVAFINSEFAAEERRRLLAEETAREERERRQRLFDDLAASLQSAAGDSQGPSSGAENVETYEGEFELD
jgi:tetratricopeptide (TPR) repeat protein